MIKELTHNQINFLLTFFVNETMNEHYPDAKNIATNLITKGISIVAGTEPIWIGDIGNFIKTKSNELYIGCLEYTFDLEYFMSSEVFKYELKSKIFKLDIEKKILEKEYYEIYNLNN